MFDIFRRKNRETFSYDQAVILNIPFNNFDNFGTKADRDKVYQLEERIKQVLPEDSGVDGHEFGDNEGVVYVYGPSANSIWGKIQSILKESEFDHIDVTLQYGLAEDPETQEKKFTV